MKKSTIAIIAAAVALIIAAVILMVVNNNKSDEPVVGGMPVEVTMKVSSGTDAVTMEPVEKTLHVALGTSVYEVLEASGVQFDAQDSEYGKFVTSIAGVAGTDNTGWVYMVNGEFAMDGADAHIVVDGDVIDWQIISW